MASQSAMLALLPATADHSPVTACGAHELCEWLFPHLRGLRIEQIEPAGAGVVIEARSAAAGAACPACGAWSSRVHSGYVRQLADGPAGGRAVLIRLAVRRLLCGNPACPAVTFAERVEGLSARYKRRSLPLLGLLAQVGLALAGRAGARLAAALGIAVHRSTLLGLVAALPEPGIGAAPEVTGVDDFALRKGRVYGTVLVDLATGKAIELLADREAGTLEAWLAAHPGAKVICRDRAGAYADGARQGAPDAIQVADRWHLWHNPGEYVEKAVAAHRGCLTRPVGAPAEGSSASASPGPAAAGPASPAAEPEGLRDVCGRERRLVARTRDRHAAVHGLLAAGHSQRAAARILGLSKNTVNRFAAAASADELLVKATSRPAKPGRHKPYLRQRRNEGITNATVLHAELQARGWHGSVQAVERYVRPFRAMTAAPPPAPVVPVNPPDHPMAAQPPRHPHRGRPGAAFLHPGPLPAPERPGGPRAQLRRDDDPPPRPARTRNLAHRRRGRRPARTALLRQRHPPRPASRHRRAHPALQLRRRRGQRQPDQDAQTPDVRPRRLRPAAQARHPAPRVTPITEFAPEPAKWARAEGGSGSIVVIGLARLTRPGGDGA